MRAKFRNYIINATYRGDKPAKWDSRNYNNHTITVRNTETGKKTSFDFWASLAAPELVTDYNILNAFYCFVEDAIAGEMSFEDFCADFGYDSDSMTAYRTWKACKRAAAKLERITNEDIYDLANDLSEDYA